MILFYFRFMASSRPFLAIYSLLWANYVRNGFLVIVFLCQHLDLGD